MDPCLHLALLEASHDCDLAEEVMFKLPHWERGSRYSELIAAEIPADVRKAEWTDRALLLPAIPDSADKAIRSLSGIEAFPGLRNLYLRMSQVEDLGPLLALPTLAMVWLGVTEQTDLTPLLSCDRLLRVHLDGPILPATPAFAVLETLAARGVQVDNLLPDPDEVTAPFADPILKLAVLDELEDSVTLPAVHFSSEYELEDSVTLPAVHFSSEYELEDSASRPAVHFFDEYEFDDDNLTRVLAVEISQEQLDSIETLSWVGGEGEVTSLVWAQWDGESDEFDIRSLEGIEALPNLKKLKVSPLEILPADQVAGLRARGVAVEGYWG